MISPIWRDRSLVAWLAALTLLRLGFAAVIPPVPDETYYWVWSHALAPAYVDHPGMVAYWIRAGTLLAGESSLGLRLLGPLGTAVGTALLADAAERLFPGRRAGWWAMLLYSATPLTTGNAILMTPDTPLLAFWSATLWAAARLATGGGAVWWLVAGAASGLAMASKYTAAFLPLGLLLWLVWVPSLRFWLRRPGPWLGALAALAMVLPVVIWNADHGWASFARQGGRLGDWHWGQALQFLGELFAGQLGLASPVIAVLLAAGIYVAVRQAWQTRDAAWSLLAAMTLPACIVFVQHATGDRVQGNWPAILYPAAAIAAAGLQGQVVRRARGPGAALGFALMAVVCIHAATLWPGLSPAIDPTARLMDGWDALENRLADQARDSQAAFVAVTKYATAADLAWRHRPPVPLLGLDSRWALTRLPPARLSGQTGLILMPADAQVPPPPGLWTDVRDLGEVARTVGGQVVETYRLVQATAVADTAQAVVLPHR